MAILCARSRVLSRTRLRPHRLDLILETTMPVSPSDPILPDLTPVDPTPSDAHRETLRADCSNCFGLCCVALSFARSADFALDKSAGEPCVNLQDDFACGIHQRLRPAGFKGCTVFDCFGAGQKVAQSTYAGVSWVHQPDTRVQMFTAFGVMRELHEMLWYLTEAAERDVPAPLRAEVEALRRTTANFAEREPDYLAALDLGAHRGAVGELLGRVSEWVRSPHAARWLPTQQTREVGPRADLLGRDRAGASLRGATLRGAVLIAANMTGADLTAVDLLGADVRDARLDDADLAESLFLTQQQVNSANGNARTRLPHALRRPDHWR